MPLDPEQIGLHSLKPKPGSRHPRKRVGRGEPVAVSRSGFKSRPGAEGGQMPVHLRLRKLRGPHMKK